MKKLYLVITLLYFISLSAQSNSGFKIYLDCNNCDKNYIKENINFTSFVNNRQSSDLHVMINSTATGGGGDKYNLIILGRNEFNQRADTLNFNTYISESNHEIRQKVVNYLKAGLLRYGLDKNTVGGINIQSDLTRDTVQQTDNWNNWVFTIDMDTKLKGEKRSSEKNLGLSFEAKRITKEWKSINKINLDYDNEVYRLDSGNVVGITKKGKFDGLLVKSLNEKWSAGSKFSLNSSTYHNLKSSFSLFPALEYNIFPYSESVYKLLTINYGIGYKHNKYIYKTIHGKKEENLFLHRFDADLEVNQSWGGINISVQAQNYIPQVEFNHLRLHSFVHFNIIKGFSIYWYGHGSFIYDQIALTNAEKSDAAVLLNLRQSKTDYSYSTGIGFEYSFGSIYNNVVNPRF